MQTFVIGVLSKNVTAGTVLKCINNIFFLPLGPVWDLVKR